MSDVIERAANVKMDEYLRAVARDLRRAPGGDAEQGLLDSTWKEHPHRVLFAACRAIQEAADHITALQSAPVGVKVGPLLWSLQRSIERAEAGAGTLPAKDAVKLRPEHWNGVCREVRELASALQPERTGS